jgi:EpsG-like putative glucosyltransferase
MGDASIYNLFPYFAASGVLLLFATLRGWKFHDPRIDRLLAVLLILIAATAAGSADLGTDAASYHSTYDEIRFSRQLYNWWDPGFVWLALFFTNVGASFGVFVFALVLISHLIKLYVYDKLVDNTVLVFFVLFCFNLGEVAFVRQYLAASIILLSFYLLSRRRVVAAVLAIFAATLIHKTAFPVGVLVILIYYGRAALKPGIVLALTAGVVFYLLPAQFIQTMENRVFAQVADYTVEGFTQGLGDEETSLVRNVAKFAVYILIALWMYVLPPKTAAERLQIAAARVVFALSAVSVALIAISPVFSRFSLYVFPFLALSIRAERFTPEPKRVPLQSAVVAMLLANLVISTYPLMEFL